MSRPVRARPQVCAWLEKHSGPRDCNGGEAAESDGVHAAEVGIFLPDFIATSEHGAAKGTDHDKNQEKGYQPLAASEQPAQQRKK